MKLLSRSMLAAAVMAAALSFCATAGAAVVTVGPGLSGSWVRYRCGVPSCTYLNGELAGTGANLSSPVTGAIIGFNVVDGVTSGTYRIRTANQAGATTFSFAKLSATVAAIPNGGVQSYPISLPITAGQTVALTTSETASLGFQEVGRTFEWETELPETGSYAAEESYPEIAGFNVEVQPAPTISALGTTSGLTTGGTSVTIAGTDFEGASGVSFGSTPATSYVVNSESQITATAPASASATAVPVTVTTVAGTATSPQTFTYEKPVYCVVPNLAGRKLAAAKKALGKAKCKVGTIKKLAGASAKTGKVSKQSPKAGSKLAVGSKVAVTLKPAKTAGKKHKK